jgi:hypothetical protein
MTISGLSIVWIVLLGVGVSPGVSPRTIAAGSWGGPHVNLTVTPAGISLEFDCAAGSAKGPAAVDRKGRFKLYGTYVSQSGSPSASRVTHPTEYSGSVKGKRMTLEVKFADTKQSVGTYHLILGQRQRLNKCPAGRPSETEPPPSAKPYESR